MLKRCLILFVCLASSLAAAEQQFGEIGDLKLESGEVIKNCRLGYRTYGELNAGGSNVVLWPTWFGGTTENLDGMVGPGKLVDSSKHYVITVDALGNGVSTSPSNSSSQRGGAFPKFNIRDMVNSQHALLTKVMGIEKLQAVLGISMGGMQTFEWMVAYPGMMRKAVPIVGTTRQTAMDLMLWGAELRIIEAAQRDGGDRAEAMKTVGLVHLLALETPTRRVRETPVEDYQTEILDNLDTYGRRSDYDWASQLRAMMAQDISRHFGGSFEQAAEAVKAEVLVIIAAQDHMVNPAPAREFRRMLGASMLVLEGDCGHRATGCEAATMNGEVGRFLDQ